MPQKETGIHPVGSAAQHSGHELINCESKEVEQPVCMHCTSGPGSNATGSTHVAVVTECHWPVISRPYSPMQARKIAWVSPLLPLQSSGRRN